MNFFEKYYPDSINLIGKEKLISDYFSTKPSMLISIKVSIHCMLVKKTGSLASDKPHAELFLQAGCAGQGFGYIFASFSI